MYDVPEILSIVAYSKKYIMKSKINVLNVIYTV